jgi:hypothetical protein
MALKRILMAVLVALPLAPLGGCVSQSSFSGYAQATDKDAAQVNSGNYNVTASAQIAIVQNPDLNDGLISPKALKKIQQYNISCQRQIAPQLAGAGQSGVNGAVPYGAAGAGTGPAAALAFHGASMGAYSIYGALAYVLPGAVNGLVTGSYALASAVGTCTRDFWSDIVDNDPDFAGTHVEVVYAGKAWGDSHPPALDHSAVAAPPAQ